MRKSLLVAMGLLLAVSFSNVAKAEDRPYGMAGCGLWTYVIKDKSMGAQLGIFALRYFILNVQTFAITSGTSNCVNNASSTASTEREVYVAANLTELSKEAAQGGGTHISGLAQLLGCEDQDSFAKMSQAKYSRIFDSSDPEVVLDKYLNEVKSHEVLAKSCTRA